MSDCPDLGELVGGVLQYLAVAGIGPESVTIITAPDAASSDWIDELPDEFADVHTKYTIPTTAKLAAAIFRPPNADAASISIAPWSMPIRSSY
jgi:hypothetical protein